MPVVLAKGIAWARSVPCFAAGYSRGPGEVPGGTDAGSFLAPTTAGALEGRVGA